MKKTTSAGEVADFLLWFGAEHGDPLTNLKLQKLVYYSQAWHLARIGAPLFPEKLEAWVHGPVEPKLHRRLKPFGFSPVPPPARKPALTDNIESHLREVFSVYGRYSAWDLERMTHAEEPWITARAGKEPDEPSNATIAHAKMAQFYRKLAGETA